MSILDIAGKQYRLEGITAQIVELLVRDQQVINGIEWGEILIECKPRDVTLTVRRSMRKVTTMR